MTLEDLRDHLYDVDSSLAVSRKRLERLEQDMEKRLEDALDAQGAMYSVLVSEMVDLEGEIEMETLLFSMLNTEKSNVREIVRLKEAGERLGKVKLISGDQQYKTLLKDIREGKEVIQKKIDTLKKTRDSLHHGSLGGSISTDDPRVQKFATLISQMQNARAKGLDTESMAAKQELRKAVKDMYASQSFDM
jgi:hypothetical protein